MWCILLDILYWSQVEHFRVQKDFFRFQLRSLAASDRLNAFVGLVFNTADATFLTVWKYECRCPLRHLLFSTDYTVNAQFRASFIVDIVKVGPTK